MTARVLTGFSGLDDGELDIEAANAVTGLTGNSNFTFSDDSLTNFSAAAQAYHNALGAVSTGGKTAVVQKNKIRAALLPLFSAVAVIVNQQAAGNEAKLLSSGIKLAATREHHQQPLPVNLQVANGTNSDMLISVKHSPVGDHGTVFAYTPATNTVTDPNLWTQKTVNGHKVTISGLTPGNAFHFTAAYKGLDDEALVWAPPVNKIVSN